MREQSWRARTVPQGLRTDALAVALVLAASILGAGSPVTASPVTRVAPAKECSAVADSIPNLTGSGQLITVVAASAASQHAALSLYQRVGACFVRVAGPYSAFVGVNGLSRHRREGDGTTPLGVFAIDPTMYGILPDPGVRFAYHQLVCGDWWDEDSDSPDYNRLVHVPCGVTPSFAARSEDLWLEAPSYDYFAVIEFNWSPVVPGLGSGMFLHVNDDSPTHGCVSLARADLIHVLRALQPALHPMIDITVSSELRVAASSTAGQSQ